MTREHWVYVNISKDLDTKVNELLEKDNELKELGIKRSRDYYTYLARKYIEEKSKTE